MSGSIQVNLKSEFKKFQSKLGGQICESRAEQRSVEKGSCARLKKNGHIHCTTVLNGCWEIHQLWSNGGFHFLKLFYFFTPFKFLTSVFFLLRITLVITQQSTEHFLHLLKFLPQTDRQTDKQFLLWFRCKALFASSLLTPGIFLARLLFVRETLYPCLHSLCLIWERRKNNTDRKPAQCWQIVRVLLDTPGIFSS